MLAHYKGLLAEVDRISLELAARYGAHLECKPGCTSCCRHDLTVFKIEAASVRAAFLDLPAETRSLVVAQAEEVQARKALGQRHHCPLMIRPLQRAAARAGGSRHPGSGAYFTKSYSGLARRCSGCSGS